MANSKRKGSKFELKVAKWFTAWTQYKFGRTPGSGSFHQNRDLASDISCIDERHAHRCKISVECKSYRDIKFEHVLLGNKSCDIIRFWDQAFEDGQRSQKIPILCMRYNSMPSEEFFFVVDERLQDIFSEVCPTEMDLFKEGYNLYVFMASEVIKYVKYKSVHKRAKELLRS